MSKYVLICQDARCEEYINLSDIRAFSISKYSCEIVVSVKWKNGDSSQMKFKPEMYNDIKNKLLGDKED